MMVIAWAMAPPPAVLRGLNTPCSPAAASCAAPTPGVSGTRQKKHTQQLNQQWASFSGSCLASTNSSRSEVNTYRSRPVFCNSAGQEEGATPDRESTSGPPKEQDPRYSDGVSDLQQPPPMVRVRLSVHYRVHSRQMLCIGGNQIPFGWSFLSIAKVPMRWTEGDVWVAEVELPANTRVEYKYVIMEEQDWTNQIGEDEGVVSFSYRTEPDSPPDVQTIQKYMAIVAWQPGPNRIMQVPDVGEIESLPVGEVRPRQPAKQPQRSYSSRQYGQQAYGQRRLGLPPLPSLPPQSLPPPAARAPPAVDELKGTWETICKEESGEAVVERRDVWGFSDSNPPSPMRGLRFG